MKSLGALLGGLDSGEIVVVLVVLVVRVGRVRLTPPPATHPGKKTKKHASPAGLGDLDF